MASEQTKKRRLQLISIPEKAKAIDLSKKLQWYALTVPPQKEFVAQIILYRKGLPTFLPVRREWRRKNKFTKEKEQKEFAAVPRYVFAGFPQGMPLWFDLFALPLINGVVGVEGAPVRIPNKAMEIMIGKCGGGMNAPKAHKFMKTHREFNAGDKAQIIDGPFSGISVPVVEIAGAKAKVILELFGTMKEIDLPLEVLEAA